MEEKSILKKIIILTKYDIRYWSKRFLCFLLSSGRNGIKRKISGADIVSFDIFDTLIKRRHKNPRKVFNQVKAKCKERGIYPKNRDFVVDRVYSEKKARERYSGREITIEEIYAEFTWLSPDTRKAIIEIEKETEFEEAYVSKKAIALFEYAKTKHKRVIITSDMYLNLPFIDMLLKDKGIDGYEDIYLSSHIGKTKSEGGLYVELLNQYPQNKILHIGDSIKADFVGAKKNSINSVLLFS